MQAKPAQSCCFVQVAVGAGGALFQNSKPPGEIKLVVKAEFVGDLPHRQVSLNQQSASGLDAQLLQISAGGNIDLGQPTTAERCFGHVSQPNCLRKVKWLLGFCLHFRKHPVDHTIPPGFRLRQGLCLNEDSLAEPIDAIHHVLQRKGVRKGAKLFGQRPDSGRIDQRPDPIGTFHQTQPFQLRNVTRIKVKIKLAERARFGRRPVKHTIAGIDYKNTRGFQKILLPIEHKLSLPMKKDACVKIDKNPLNPCRPIFHEVGICHL